MPIRKYKPTSPARRFQTVQVFDDITSTEPYKPLIEPLRAVLERPMLTVDGAAAPLDVASREITVLGDKALPYEVVRKVMATCTAAAYGKISLAVLEKEKPVGSGGPRSA